MSGSRGVKRWLRSASEKPSNSLGLRSAWARPAVRYARSSTGAVRPARKQAMPVLEKAGEIEEGQKAGLYQFVGALTIYARLLFSLRRLDAARNGRTGPG